jgi:hypothetical protein
VRIGRQGAQPLARSPAHPCVRIGRQGAQPLPAQHRDNDPMAKPPLRIDRQVHNCAMSTRHDQDPAVASLQTAVATAASGPAR